jgi:hypothetical protein
MGEKVNEYEVLVLKPNGKRPYGRTRHGWVNNIKTNLEYI